MWKDKLYLSVQGSSWWLCCWAGPTAGGHQTVPHTAQSSRPSRSTWTHTDRTVNQTFLNLQSQSARRLWIRFSFQWLCVPNSQIKGSGLSKNSNSTSSSAESQFNTAAYVKQSRPVDFFYCTNLWFWFEYWLAGFSKELQMLWPVALCKTVIWGESLSRRADGVILPLLLLSFHRRDHHSCLDINNFHAEVFTDAENMSAVCGCKNQSCCGF